MRKRQGEMLSELEEALRHIHDLDMCVHQHSTHHPSAVVFPFLAVGPFYSTILLYTFIYINTRTFNTIQNHVIYWIEKRLFFFDKRGIIDVIKKTK